MVTIRRAHGLRIVIYTSDHEPAHVHVFGDGHARINLTGPDGGRELIWAEGMKRNEVRRAMAVVTGHRDVFLVQWREIHG